MENGRSALGFNDRETALIREFLRNVNAVWENDAPARALLTRLFEVTPEQK